MHTQNLKQQLVNAVIRATVVAACGVAGLAVLATAALAHSGRPSLQDRVGDELSLLSASSDRLDLDRPVEVFWNACRPKIHTTGEPVWDCTRAFEDSYGFPAMHPLYFSDADFERNRSGEGHFYCELLRVRTVTRANAAANASAIGFWYSGFPGTEGIRTVPKSDWVQVATAEMKNGERGLVHQFIGLANCQQVTPERQMRVYEFKPFLETVDERQVVRAWDRHPGNYWVRADHKEVNFSREVLR